MASYMPGYDDTRFAITVNQNFLCLICFNVLKDPVLCSRNQHCFCRGCITKHLENSQRCPTCADELTVETLAEPQRMVKDYLNELPTRCVFIDRGCQEIVQLQHLDRHEATCGFTPAVCTNQGCGATVNKRDLIHHESEQCEFRKLKCHSCEETTKTLENMEKRMGDLETKIGNLEKNMEKNIGAVNNEVTGLKTALIESFDEMKDVLVKIKENTKKIRNTPSGDKENIIIAGGVATDSVEIFNWSQKSWAPLQSLPKEREGATSVVYNNHVITAGGNCADSGCVDNMIRMKIDPNPDLSKHWSDCPVKLPAKLAYHSAVLYNDQLYVTGGCIEDMDQISDCIHAVQLVPPYTVRTLSSMPEPRQGHGTEIFDDNLMIVGGSTSEQYEDSLSSVLLYDIKRNECKQLAPLPYEVCDMATVRCGDNIVVIGGIDKDGKELDTVIMYNVKTEQCHMLPRMRCKRRGCAAVVIANNIVVLGGTDGHEDDYLKSVEAFNFENYHWEELPEMSQERWLHTSVVV